MALEHAPYADISLDAFAANVAHAKKTLAVKSQLMVAVKSDAYGHGVAELAPVAITAGADALAVLDIATGVSLRRVMARTPLLCWLLSPHDDFAAGAKARLDLGISSLWQLDKLASDAPGMATRVHLKIDTGLHRNGALAKDWPGLISRAVELEKLGHIRVVGIWSHLADTSLSEDRLALDRFHQAVALATEAGLSPEILHIAASAAATDLPESRLDLVRVGISVYGLSPFDDRSAPEMGFAPVMALRAPVVFSDADNGSVILGIGYGDGVLPLAPNTGWIAWGNTRLDIACIEVDQIVLHCPTEQVPGPGEVLTLWGDPALGSPRAEDWASWGNTIGDEVVTSLASHVQRRFISHSD